MDGLDLRNVYRSDKIATVILCWSHALCDGVAGAWITMKWRENYVKYSLKYLVSDSNENLKDFSCSKRDKHTKCLQIVSQQFLPRCKQANTTDLISLQRQTTKKRREKKLLNQFFLFALSRTNQWKLVSFVFSPGRRNGFVFIIHISFCDGYISLLRSVNALLKCL